MSRVLTVAGAVLVVLAILAIGPLADWLHLFP